jgi:two-component system nitrogen regulation sensor histidine kinase NtrY
MFGTKPAPIPPPTPPRRRVLDNPRVLAVLGLLLAAIMAGLFWLSSRTSQIEPQILNDVMLTALLSVNVALIVALVFVLARNLLKLWVEQRRGAPFAKFRTKLVGALLAMTIIPAVLVLISGSEILRTSVAQWFTGPGDQVVTGALNIATRFYSEQQKSMAVHAKHLADRLPAASVAQSDEVAVTPQLSAELETMRDSTIEVYRVVPGPAGGREAALVLASESPSMPRDRVRAAADRLAQRTVESGKTEEATEDLVESGGVMFRASAPILGADRSIVGVVVVSRYLDTALVRDAKVAQAAYNQFKSLFVLQGPILGSYQSIFLAATLLILIAATWLGLYLAKRITRPVQQLAEGAKAIGAGHLDVRLEAESGDELGSLVEDFNMMAAELQTSRSKLDQSRTDLERKNAEVDGRRPLHRNRARAGRHRCHFTRCRRRDFDDERRGRAIARRRRFQHRPAGAEGARSRGPAAAAAAPGSHRGPCRAGHRAGNHARSRRPRDQPRHGRDGAGRHRRIGRRGAGAGRRDAVDPRAARRRLARRGAAARARNQESADADPAQRGTDAAPLLSGAARVSGARQRVHRRDHCRG